MACTRILATLGAREVITSCGCGGPSLIPQRTLLRAGVARFRGGGGGGGGVPGGAPHDCMRGVWG